MSYVRLNLEKQIKVIGVDTYTINSGYFRVDDSRITSQTQVFAQQQYKSGQSLTYFFTPQAQSGFMNVYVRKNDGSNPADNTTVNVTFILVG